jgi:hypothetical protein
LEVVVLEDEAAVDLVAVDLEVLEEEVLVAAVPVVNGKLNTIITSFTSLDIILQGLYS